MNYKGAVMAGFEVLDLHVHVGTEGKPKMMPEHLAPGPIFEPRVKTLGVVQCALVEVSSIVSL
jgi:hypothetical protein